MGAWLKQNTFLEETGFLGSVNIFCGSLIASQLKHWGERRESPGGMGFTLGWGPQDSAFALHLGDLSAPDSLSIHRRLAGKAGRLSGHRRVRERPDFFSRGQLFRGAALVHRVTSVIGNAASYSCDWHWSD